MFQVNDVVAVVRRLPWGEELITITKVRSVGVTVIETFDDRVFCAADGESIGQRETCYLQRIRPEHLRMWSYRRTVGV